VVQGLGFRVCHLRVYRLQPMAQFYRCAGSKDWLQKTCLCTNLLKQLPIKVFFFRRRAFQWRGGCELPHFSECFVRRCCFVEPSCVTFHKGDVTTLVYFLGDINPCSLLAGIWTADLKRRTNLQQPQINKALMNLEGRSLVKAVKTVTVRFRCPSIFQRTQNCLKTWGPVSSFWSFRG